MGIGVSAISSDDTTHFSKSKSPNSPKSPTSPTNPFITQASIGSLQNSNNNSFSKHKSLPGKLKKTGSFNNSISNGINHTLVSVGSGSSLHTPSNIASPTLGVGNSKLRVSSNDLTRDLSNNNLNGPSINGNVNVLVSNNSSNALLSVNTSPRRRYSSQMSVKHQTQIEPDKLNILLLGAGEVGKTVLFKLMKYLCEGPAQRSSSLIDLDVSTFYNEQDLKEFTQVIRENTLHNLRWIIEGSEDLSIAIIDEELKVKAFQLADKVSEMEQVETLYSNEEGKILKEFCEFFERLWKDQGIQETFKRRNEYRVYDNVEYFFENFERIFNDDYIPILKDILYMREKALGVQELKYRVEDAVTVSMIDMGGSRHERKKWIHQFHTADVILFVVSLAEFDLNCFEDGETPRWKESFDIFMNLLYNPSFAKLPFVLLFNKKDLLEQKLANQSSFANHFKEEFPSDKNGQNLDDCIQFLVDKYSSCVKNRQLLINPGECCIDSCDENAGPSMLVRVLNAFDENNLLTVFKDVTEYSIREHQRRYLQALTITK